MNEVLRSQYENYPTRPAETQLRVLVASAGDAPDPKRIDAARQLLDNLPEPN